GELGRTRDLALPARDGHGRLKLAVQWFVGPIEVNSDVLQHPELTRPNPGTGHIGAFAPYCARAEAQLHVIYSLSKASSAAAWWRGRSEPRLEAILQAWSDAQDLNREDCDSLIS